MQRRVRAVIYGVDVSSFQPKVNWAQLRKDGYEFASVRCCEGLDLDSMHDTHIKDAKSEGFKAGSYQVGHPSMDVQKLVQFFMSHAHIEPGDMMPSPDMETLATGPDGNKYVPKNAGPWTNEWAETIKRALGVNSLPYASPSYWQTMCSQCPDLGGASGWNWWMAWYTGATQPKTYAGQPLIYAAHQCDGNVPLRYQVGLWDRDVVYEETLSGILIPVS